MRNFSLFTFIFSLCFLTACGQKTPAPAEPRGQYVMPDIPEMLSSPDDRARYAAEHFWDNYDFTDTAAVADPAYTEQAVVDYVNLLLNIPPDIAHNSIPGLFERARAEKNTFLTFAETAEKYLYDPNSPFRNEELYITVLNSVLANPALDQYERVRPTAQLALAKKNRAGTPAADFTYTLANGRTGTLYGLKAPWTLVFFNNPGCPACAQAIAEINASAFLTRTIEDGRLRVLAVYADADTAAWEAHAKDFPTAWINARDASAKIKTEEIYDLRAIPTIYLLDAAKRVVLKDVMSIPLIEETINGNN